MPEDLTVPAAPEAAPPLELCEQRVDTPVGPLGLLAGASGLLRVAFSGRTPAPAALARRLGRPVRLVHDRGWLAEPARQVGEYFAGRLRAFDLALDWSLLDDGFARLVLDTLHREVGFGRVVSYEDLAVRAGRPGTARAVGMAMGANPLPVVVPCHRVVAADGLGGFGGGLETKRRLLALEGVLPPALDLA